MNGNTENIDAWLRPRGAQAHKRPRHHRSFGPAFAEAAPPATSREARPPLGMPEPDSTRHTVVSGSISLAAHGAVVAGLAISAWYAPDVVDELIPVRIIKDTTPVPEPAPARRVVLPKRNIRSRVPKRIAQPTPVQPPQVQQLTQRAPQIANIDTTAAPTQVQQRQITSQRVVNQRTLVATNPSAVSVAQFTTAAVAPTQMSAPQVDVTGPRRIAPVTQVDVTAPQAFSQATPTVDYTDRASADSSDAVVAVTEQTVVMDASTSFALEGRGGVSGGEGTAAAGIPCMQRESVNTYLVRMSERLEAEWTRFDIPEGTRAGATVKVAFTLDESGMARDIEIVSAPTPGLGKSCQQALVAASPFAALVGNTRCLAKHHTATFRVPVAENSSR